MMRIGFATFDQVSKENVRTRVPRTPLKNRSSQARADLICEVQIQFGGAFPPSPASALPKALEERVSRQESCQPQNWLGPPDAANLSC